MHVSRCKRNWRQRLGIAVVAVVAATAAQAAEPSRPLVVGHRGLMHAAPECTLAAFRACLAHCRNTAMVSCAVRAQE